MLLSKLLLAKGLAAESEKFKQEAQEEMEHVERIIARLIGFACAPNASHLRPAKLKGSLVEVIKNTSQLEMDIVTLYDSAVSYCEKQGDVENKLFFAALLKEEQHHYEEMETLVKRVTQGNLFESHV